MLAAIALRSLATAVTIAAPAGGGPGRGYDGVRSIEAPVGDDGPAPAVAPRPVKPEPFSPDEPIATAPGEVAPPQPPQWFIDARPEPRQRPRRAPRVLTTIAGPYPGEQAKIRARGRFVSFVPGLQVRTRTGAVSEFALDPAGNAYFEGATVGGRVRWRPQLGFGRADRFKLVGMLDLVNGRWAPRDAGNAVVDEIIDQGEPPVITGLRIVDPRELYAELRLRYGLLRLGQMSFTWGQGLLANDGNNMDRFGDLKFGNDGDGSIQERIIFATKPGARRGGPGKDVILAVGADLIFRDPNADLVQGDLAGQGFVVVRYEPQERPGNWVGAYGVYRRQRNADDGDIVDGDDLLEVGVVDFAGQGYRNVHRELALIGAFEAVVIAGRTTFPRGDFDQHRVIQAGAAVRGYVGNPKRWLAGLDAGYASGDANPSDDEVNNFEAAPGYTAGLLLFQYYNGWQTARSQIRAEDPDLAGQPPNGAQFIPSGGTVTNTVFVHPKGRYAVREQFEVWGGPLFAASASPVVDPLETQLAGGVPTNSLGRRSERRYLGTELDLGVRGRYSIRLGRTGPLWLQAGIQAAVLFPGRALTGPGDEGDRPVWGGWFRAELRY